MRKAYHVYHYNYYTKSIYKLKLFGSNIYHYIGVHDRSLISQWTHLIGHELDNTTLRLI